jgi:hypothetical protein
MLLSTVMATLPAHAGARCADADGNGSVTVADGVQALRAAADLASVCTLATCDVDGDGTVEVVDGVGVLRAAASLPVELACPGAGPACESATATVTLATPAPIGAATLTLAYPTAAVTLPGSGEAAAARVTILTATPLLQDGSPNDRDDRVEFALVAFDGVASGALLAVRFDCLAAAPAAGAFGCALADAVATDGVTAVAGATCTVEVAAE